MSATKKMWQSRFGSIGNAWQNLKDFVTYHLVEIFIAGSIICVILSPIFTGPAKAEVTRYRLALELRDECVKTGVRAFLNDNKKALTYGDLAVIKTGSAATATDSWWLPFTNDSVYESQRKVLESK